MGSETVREIYDRHIRSLPAAERLHLLALVAQGLASERGGGHETKRNIMDLHGLGKEIWGEIDPQEYVDELREEWDRQP